MGVYKRGNKWYCRGRINGERYHKCCTGATNKEEAKALEDAERYRIRQIQIGLIKEEGKYTFGFLMDNYVNVCSANNRNVKDAHTKRKYLCEYFGRNKNIRNIRPTDIEQFKLYLKSKGRSNATINRYLAAIKRAYNLLLNDDLITYTPMKKIALLEENNRRYRYLTKQEWNRLRMSMPKYLYDIVLVALLTGLRRKNVLNLKWEQINFSMGFLEVLKQDNKGGKVIRLPMSDYLIQHFQSLNPKESGYVFVNPDTGLPFVDIKRAFKSALKRAGISDFKFHDIRRTVGTWLLQAGVDIRAIQQILAHSDIRTTERYLAVSQERNRCAVNLLDNMLQ